MKKLLLGIITILVIVLTGITLIKGFKIGNIIVYGITDIQKENEQLDQKIQQATKLASTDYQKKLDDLEDANKKFKTEKTTYDDMVNVSTDTEVQVANQSYDYELDFLWVRIENHAKTEGVSIKLDLARNSSGVENVYNLNFTASGSYAGIEEFITHIEDDDKLGFKIEDFKMTAESSENSNTLQATFNCKNVKINGISANTINVTTQDSTKQENTDTAQTNNNTTQGNTNSTQENNNTTQGNTNATNQ